MTQAAWGADVATANNDVGFELLRHLDPGGSKNAFISPFSISEALTLTANGARAGTLDAMRAALKLKQISLGDANSGYKKLGHSFSVTGMLKVANGLFVQKSFPLQQPFVTTAQEQFSATVESVDYAARTAEGTINHWVSDKTNHKIPSIVNGLNEATKLVIVNAVYFKAPWSHEFAEEETQPAAFHVTAHDTIKIPTMHAEQRYPYAQLDGVEAISMPYRGATMAMTILLPAKDSSVEAALKLLSTSWWQKLTSAMTSRSVDLHMPKFKIEYSSSLKAALGAIGMHEAFTDKADFSGIANVSGQPLFISDAIHKTYLDVNEKGTEAAAATAVVMVGAMAPMPQTPVEFRVDRPFIVAISDSSSGTVLFLGVIRDPRK